jgi:phage-related protein
MKLVKWVGDSRKRIREFPAEVRYDIGSALFDVQMGDTPSNAKLLKGIGAGVFEIVTRYHKDTWRTVYAVKLGDRIYVLHAFQKKSKRGISTPKKEIDLIKQRYKRAVEMEEMYHE